MLCFRLFSGQARRAGLLGTPKEAGRGAVISGFHGSTGRKVLGDHVRDAQRTIRRQYFIGRKDKISPHGQSIDDLAALARVRAKIS